MATTSAQSILRFLERNLSIRRRLCSLQRFETGYALEPRIIADYNLIYISRGAAVWEIGGVEHLLNTGGLAVVPPGVSHRAWSTVPAVTIVSIHVEGLLPGGRDGLALAGLPLQLDVPPDSRLADYFRLAEFEFERKDPERTLLMLTGWVQIITRELLLLCEAQRLLNPTLLDPVVQQVLSDLQSQRANPISLDQLAERSGFSPQHLNRLFQRTLGMTPIRIHQRLRLEEAAHRLRDSNLTAEAVAEQLGFEDPSYFSRAFKRHFGQTPSQYRASASSENPI